MLALCCAQVKGVWARCFCNSASSLKDKFCPSKRNSWSVLNAVCFYWGGRCTSCPGRVFGHPFLSWREKLEVLAHSRAGLWPGAKPRDKMSHVHPRAWWEWEQECCVLAGLMEEACDANTAFVLPKSTGLHCAPLCIHVLLYFLYKRCFFPPERAVERCIALYPSFTLALFLVSFLSLSPRSIRSRR